MKYGTQSAIFNTIIGLALLFYGTATAESPLPPSIVIDDIKGEIQIFRSGELEGKPVQMGQSLNPDDTIQTGKGASAKILVEGTGEIELKEETTWSYQEFATEDGKKSFSAYLALGRLKAKVKKLPSGSDFAIKTPTSIAAVRGTAFGLYVYMFEQQYFTQLDVVENAVAFSNLTGDQAVLVDEGKSSVGNADGDITPPQTSGEQTEKALREGERNAADGPNPPGGGSGNANSQNEGEDTGDNSEGLHDPENVEEGENTGEDTFNVDNPDNGKEDLKEFGEGPVHSPERMEHMEELDKGGPPLGDSPFGEIPFEAPAVILEELPGQDELRQEIESAGDNVTGAPDDTIHEPECTEGSNCSPG